MSVILNCLFLGKGKIFLFSKILFWIIDQNAANNCRSYFPLGNETSKKEKQKSDKEKSKMIDRSIKYQFTQSTFIKKSSMVITGTTDGRIIVWDKCPALCKENENINDRRKIKEVQLFNPSNNPNSIRCRINFLINYEQYIVVGSGDGGIKFYDSKFIITRWFDNIGWTITSISFDFVDPSEREELEEDEERNKNFHCLPFIISDVSATVKRVFKKLNEREKFYGHKTVEIDHDDKDVKIDEIYRGIESNISAVALHPRDEIIVIGVDNKAHRDSKQQKEIKSKEPIIKEKRFEYRPYIQIFNYPDHMKPIKQEIKREEEINQLKLINKKVDDKKIDDTIYVNPYKRYLDGIPTAIEYSPCGKYLIVGTNDDKIYVINPENLNEMISPKVKSTNSGFANQGYSRR